MLKHNARVSSDQTGCIGDLVSGLPSVGSHPAAAACSLAEESAWLVYNIRCMMYVCMYGENEQRLPPIIIYLNGTGFELGG